MFHCRFVEKVAVLILIGLFFLVCSMKEQRKEEKENEIIRNLASDILELYQPFQS